MKYYSISYSDSSNNKKQSIMRNCVILTALNTRVNHQVHEGM